LIIEDDAVFAELMGDVIRGQGLRSRWAPDGKTGLEWAKEKKPSGIILDVKLPDFDGFTIMDELRADPDTADVPVHFISAVDAAERGIAMGATGYLTKPASVQDLLQVVESLAPKVPEQPCRILVVEDDAPAGDSLVKQLTAENLEARRVGTAKDALDAFERERYGCLILDLSLPDMDGLDLLMSLRERCGSQMPAVVIYTGRPLSKIEATRLESYAEAVVLKEGSSTERLVDEIRLFVRRLKEGVGPRRPAVARSSSSDVRLTGRKILVADDDMRTMYALSATLRAKGVNVFAADTGKAALEVLAQHPDIEAVLMDIMMPEMDGYEAMRRIRQDRRFQALPIIALTAKAMKGDKEKCLQVGASDYLPKPIDIDNLFAMLQSRLQASGHES
jgi:CheY-like chemotaxis protein